MTTCIASDSTFYICISEDAQNQKTLCEIIERYPFFLGKNILEELPTSLKERQDFKKSINYLDGNYFELVKPYFGREKKHEKDGEYEAIGIAYHLERMNLLKSLIIDERRAQNFVKSHFPSLTIKLIRSFGFLKNACCVDKKIQRDVVIDFFETLIVHVKDNSISKDNGKQRRPCGMTSENYVDIIIPIVKQIQSLED
jgi:hypothetical protein